MRSRSTKSAKTASGYSDRCGSIRHRPQDAGEVHQAEVRPQPAENGRAGHRVRRRLRTNLFCRFCAGPHKSNADRFSLAESLPNLAMGLVVTLGTFAGGCSPREYLESDVDAGVRSGAADEAVEDASAEAAISASDRTLDRDGMQNLVGKDTDSFSSADRDSTRSASAAGGSSADRDSPNSVATPPAAAAEDDLMQELFGGEDSGEGSSLDTPDASSASVSASVSASGETEVRLRTLSKPIPANADPGQLIASLGNLDADVRTMVAGGDPNRTPAENRELLLAFLETKWDVADALVIHPDSAADQVTLGKRAAIEAMSGLASLGMESAVGSLREASEAAIGSASPGLKIDGHLVQLSMATRQFVAGGEDAADSMIRHVDAIASVVRGGGGAVEVQTPGEATSTLVGLGRARQTLSKYGEDIRAAHVRDVITDLYADSPSSSIAMLSAEMAGQVVFNEVDQMLERLIEGENVEAERWTAAIETLIDRAPDLLTVRYLAPAALELEAAGLQQAADRIYDVLQRRFDDPDSATGQEVGLATEAMEARRAMIGKVFAPSGSDLRDQPLTLLDYRGKVVLMPFWASTSPESLSILDSLREIRDDHPEKVAIVGMNLDLTQPMPAALAHRMAEIPSFRGAAPSEPINPVASQFGLVSLPFVVVIDEKGVVSGIAYLPRQLRRETERLIDRSES